MARNQNNYRVTDATIYTVRPVVTEQRYQMIEEIKPPPSSELGPFGKFVTWVIGVPLGLWVGHWIVSLFCGCQ